MVLMQQTIYLPQSVQRGFQRRFSRRWPLDRPRCRDDLFERFVRLVERGVAGRDRGRPARQRLGDQGCPSIAGMILPYPCIRGDYLAYPLF